MGRHSAAAPAPEPEPFEPRSGSPRPTPAVPPAAGVGPVDEPPEPPGGDLRSRAVLAAAVAVATLLTTSWAGLRWGQAGIAAGGAALFVLVAGWVAGTMPTRPTPYSDARDSHDQRE